jgi:hypothetical protein
MCDCERNIFLFLEVMLFNAKRSKQKKVIMFMKEWSRAVVLNLSGQWHTFWERKFWQHIWKNVSRQPGLSYHWSGVLKWMKFTRHFYLHLYIEKTFYFKHYAESEVGEGGANYLKSNLWPYLIKPYSILILPFILVIFSVSPQNIFVVLTFKYFQIFVEKCLLL